jgi:hypothetical protein
MFDFFKNKNSVSAVDSDKPRRHHYSFAYKALPGLVFADPDVPITFATCTFSWAEIERLMESGRLFDRAAANQKLSDFWASVGAKVPASEQIDPSGLSAIGGEFGARGVVLFVKMPEPLATTEAHFVAIIYPKSWFDKTETSEVARSGIRCYLLAKSNAPTVSGLPGATLRLVKRHGHGAVKPGIPSDAQSFLREVYNHMQESERWLTWVDSPTWNFLMESPEDSQIHGSV